jgi:HlyD family secretion protein
VFYQAGEWAAANQPVVALLPDERVRLRFFVPETALPAYGPAAGRLQLRRLRRASGARRSTM